MLQKLLSTACRLQVFNGSVNFYFEENLLVIKLHKNADLNPVYKTLTWKNLQIFEI